MTDQIVTWSGQLAGDVPLVGDWNGDGKDSPGIARFGGNTWTFYLTNVVNGTGVTDQIVTWPGTLASDVPVVGDWNGDGKDSPGLVRLSGSTRTWYLTNVVNGTGVTDQIVTWSGQLAGDVPVVGDWNGDGKDSPGIARFGGSSRTWYLTNVVNGTGVTDQAVTWSGQLAGDVPLVGDWNNDGKDSPGIARLGGSSRTWYLTNVVNGTGVTDQAVTWSGQTASDEPLVGDWNGTKAGYANPLRDVPGLVAQRIDQGVDYAQPGGDAPIYALGDGTVTNTLNTGWPNGVFIVYQLSDGPAQGLYVYVAEDLTVNVSVGDHVTSSTVLGHFEAGADNGYDIETGWADPCSCQAIAMTDGQYPPPGGEATAFGRNFDQLMTSLGAPAGQIEGTETGTLPSGWPTWS